MYSFLFHKITYSSYFLPGQRKGKEKHHKKEGKEKEWGKGREEWERDNLEKRERKGKKLDKTLLC